MAEASATTDPANRPTPVGAKHRVLRRLAWLLVGLGMLMVLFAGFQIWGTGFTERSHQGELRRQFSRDVAQTAKHPPNGAGRIESKPAPTLGQPVARLEIPKIGVDQIVVQGTDDGDLRLGPGHYPGTPLPGEPGNVAIAGHRTTYGAPFANLDRLVAGDRIVLTTTAGRFVYRIRRTFVVAPTDVSVAASHAGIALTLTTCNPRYSASQRLVVQAALTSGATMATSPTPSVAPPTSAASAADAARTAGLAGSMGTSGSIGYAALWGASLLAFAWLTHWTGRRVGHRVLTALAAFPVAAVLLLLFFNDLSALLPASL